MRLLLKRRPEAIEFLCPAFIMTLKGENLTFDVIFHIPLFSLSRYDM